MNALTNSTEKTTAVTVEFGAYSQADYILETVMTDIEDKLAWTIENSTSEQFCYNVLNKLQAAYSLSAVMPYPKHHAGYVRSYLIELATRVYRELKTQWCITDQEWITRTVEFPLAQHVTRDGETV
ncbi:hypothetical protein AXJ11_gp94 [Gordonia phage GordDuk1]|uniref:Uncharacterized protein n=1 Tax=Gordonia phage GordDuk1 TaxID=1622191 RepID=A0A0E3X9Z6_9CAUD|nr:hypothetical protein AXJ11_gp94 [Gordonia phage GordDuk1]AKC03022.1 hypothetical protein GordDuk1_94 [Gordonia phage GordDuk1]